MDHRDHVALLEPGLAGEPRGHGTVWADVGAGGGAFTLALAELLGPGGRIVAVDRDRDALAENDLRMRADFPASDVQLVAADFTSPLDLGRLDGIVAANSLHFVPNDRQPSVVGALAALLRPGGAFIVVEYDADHGNRWVPYPFTFDGWRAIAAVAGLVDVRMLARRPGWLGGFYSAVGRRPVRSAAPQQVPGSAG